MKKDNARVVGRPESIKAKMEAYRQRQSINRSDLDLIFANPEGAPWAEFNLLDRLGIPKPKGTALHLLRHSHGSHLLVQSVEPTVVADQNSPHPSSGLNGQFFQLC